MTWDDEAAGWDDNPMVKAYAGGAFDACIRLLAERGLKLEGMRVLDFGCGTGLLSEALAGHAAEVVGLDPAPGMIEQLRRKVSQHAWSHVHTWQGTLEDALAQPDSPVHGPFDLIVCSSVCAFVEDYPQTLKQLASLLSEGGVFVQFDWERDESAEEPYGLSRTAIESALQGAELQDPHVGTGFEVGEGEMVMKPLVGIGRRTSA